MNKILILKAFEEAKEKKKNKGIKKPSQTDLALELSNFIDESESFRLGERSFRDYYNDAKKVKDSHEDISIKQISVINGLCKYLGFDNYQEFISSIEKNSTRTSIKKTSVFSRKNMIVIMSTLIVVIGFFTYNSATKQRWMVWQEDHYIEVDFDTEKYKIKQLKILKEERIELFKKVLPICGETTFFNVDGSVAIWYGKNKDKTLEYFTALGLHPETGKTLKPITGYMIEKYICN
jgi:hypothetical protein